MVEGVVPGYSWPSKQLVKHWLPADSPLPFLCWKAANAMTQGVVSSALVVVQSLRILLVISGSDLTIKRPLAGKELFRVILKR